MEWSLDKKRAWTREIWPFEPVGALWTTSGAKAPRGSSGLPKKQCVLEVPERSSTGGLPKTPESTIGEKWSPSPVLSVLDSNQESPKGCG